MQCRLAPAWKLGALLVPEHGYPCLRFGKYIIDGVLPSYRISRGYKYKMLTSRYLKTLPCTKRMTTAAGAPDLILPIE